MNNQPTQRRQADSFTLVEMLVAITVMAVLSIALFGSLATVTSAWQRGHSQIETRQSGRAIIDYMSRELRGAELPADRSDTNNLQFVVNPDASTGAYPTNTPYYPQSIFWQAAASKPSVTSPTLTGGTLNNGAISDVMAEIGYFIRWDTTTNPGNPRANLYRFSALPYNYSTGALNTNYLIQPISPLVTANPTAWLTDASLAAGAPATQSGSYQALFAENVISLWARCLDPQGNTIIYTANQTSAGAAATAYDKPYVYDSRQGYSYPAGVSSPIIKNGFYNPNPQIGIAGTGVSQILATLPSAVEVALVIVSSRGANLITTIPTYTVTTPTTANPNPFWNDITAFVAALPIAVRRETSVYSARVALEKGI